MKIYNFDCRQSMQFLELYEKSLCSESNNLEIIIVKSLLNDMSVYVHIFFEEYLCTTHYNVCKHESVRNIKNYRKIHNKSTKQEESIKECLGWIIILL